MQPYPLGRPTRPPPPSDPSVPSVPLETLRATPEAVLVGDGIYGLQARWRVARVPINAAGVLLLVRENPGQMPDEIYFRYLWVIQGDRVWATKLDVWEKRDPPSNIEKRLRLGPVMEPGTIVDVVGGFVDVTGELRLVRQRIIPVGR